jgi:hypothetical protein
VAGRYTGITEAVLRISAQAPESKFRRDLNTVYRRISRLHPDELICCSLTANVILKSNTEGTYSCFYGQSFGNARAVYLGQEHDEETGVLTKLFTEFVLKNREDLKQLPIRFNTEDFEKIYKRNFIHSDVSVVRVISVVYLFSAGMERYDQEHTLGKTPIELFF